jgi:hypothetical protein
LRRIGEILDHVISSMRDMEDLKTTRSGEKPRRPGIYLRTGAEIADPLGLSYFMRLIIFLTGQVFVEHRRRHGWSGPLPFYAFTCPIHGVVVDYPHGYSERLECPRCYQEDDLFKTLTSGNPMIE